MYFYSYAELTYGDFERGRFEKTKSALREAKQLCQEAGARLVVLYAPMKFRVYRDLCAFPEGSPCLGWKPWQLPVHFAEFCAEAEIPFVDLAPRMQAAATEGALLYPLEDSHWSLEGHKLVASILEALWEEQKGGK